MHRSENDTCSRLIPVVTISSSGLQQSSIFSWNHLQGPFHALLGSTWRAFKTMAILASPQYAGSSCVWNCSMSEKNDSAVPSASASAKYLLPILHISHLNIKISSSSLCIMGPHTVQKLFLRETRMLPAFWISSDLCPCLLWFWLGLDRI